MMSTKSLIWVGMIVGSAVGGFIPSLWGSDVFSFSSIFLSAIFGIGGIWLGYKISN